MKFSKRSTPRNLRKGGARKIFEYFRGEVIAGWREGNLNGSLRLKWEICGMSLFMRKDQPLNLGT